MHKFRVMLGQSVVITSIAFAAACTSGDGQAAGPGVNGTRRLGESCDGGCPSSAPGEVDASSPTEVDASSSTEVDASSSTEVDASSSTEVDASSPTEVDASACAGNLVLCAEGCVDPSSDAAHCGSCDAACPAGESCAGGKCDCAPGAERCGGSCTDTASNPANCGGCGLTCAPGQICEQGQCACGPTVVSFQADVVPVLKKYCAGCHSGAKPRAGLDLTQDVAFGKLVNVETKGCDDDRVLVKPGDPAASYLIQKMLGVQMCGGNRMPPGAPVPAAELEAISQWICQGASK